MRPRRPSGWRKRSPPVDAGALTTLASASERAVLAHGAAFDVGELADALGAENVRARELTASLEALDDARVPTVLVLDDQHVGAVPALARALDALPPAVVVVSFGAEADEVARGHDAYLLALPQDTGWRTLLQLLQAAFRHAAQRLGAARAEAELAATRGEIQELSQIGMALMTERDTDTLLDTILTRAMSMTRSDAGSLYLVEKDGEDRRLRFKLSQNRSLPDLPAVEFTLPLDQTSIAGHVAITNEPVLLEDAYEIQEAEPYSFNPGFDQQFGYRARSMLVVPMADHKDDVVGVIQLINRMRDPGATIDSRESAVRHVLPYGEHELSLVRGLAGQAAVSIENARLYEQIEHIFEAFVKAAVAAIDQRDPTTAGHSVRVAALTTRIAESLPRLTSGQWKGTSLTRDQMKELRYAALLHDFGKVGVREEVLVKAKKLPPYLWERVNARFDLIHRTIEKQYLEKKVAALQQHELDGLGGMLERLDEEQHHKIQRLDEFRRAITEANEPSILPEDGAAILHMIAAETFERIGGEVAPYLAPEEFSFLTIPKGSLNHAERLEIESHVTQTYRFLTQIPWTEDLSAVAEIAYGHHEKLDGRGYPRGVGERDIPVQTRIMTIADIFDALTASDRPYKRALTAERAIDILRSEADAGMLDTDLVDLMVGSQVYREVLEADWRDL